MLAGMKDKKRPIPSFQFPDNWCHFDYFGSSPNDYGNIQSADLTQLILIGQINTRSYFIKNLSPTIGLFVWGYITFDLLTPALFDQSPIYVSYSLYFYGDLIYSEYLQNLKDRTLITYQFSENMYYLFKKSN